jgi:hypothetical protein
MKLPSETIIDPRKITHYLLRSRVENDKSNLLAQAGYTPENPAQLVADLREQILALDAESMGSFEYGEKFLIRGVLRGPNGRELRVLTIWASIEAAGVTKFITLYPDKL